MENKKKLTTVLVSGHFNVLHHGHIRLLRFAKESGDHLIVAVESDRIAGGAAHVPEDLRIEGIKSNSWVNETILLDEPVGDPLAPLQRNTPLFLIVMPRLSGGLRAGGKRGSTGACFFIFVRESYSAHGSDDRFM